MNAVERQVRRFDMFQQRHVVLAFPIAVVQKYGNDQAGGKAVLMAYYGLFALFPLLLLLTTILGWLLAGHPNWQHHVLRTALANFPIIGSQLQGDVHSLQGNTLAVAVGVLGTLYGAQGIGQAALTAMNTVWNVPFRDWPNFFGRRLRGYLWLAVLGIATVVSTTAAGFGTTWLHGGTGWLWSSLVAFGINLGVFYVIFTLLTAEPLGWRDVALGVVLATLFWDTLQAIGGFYVRHSLAHANNIYGFFAIVIGLLSWLFVAAQLTLLAAEINVVRRYRLWPRSLTQPPLTGADRAVFERLARMQERRPEVRIGISFTADADCQPLDEDCSPPSRDRVAVADSRRTSGLGRPGDASGQPK